MDYTALYQQKLTTADEAVKVVKSGDWVDYGWCTGTTVALDKALAARMGELEDVNFRGGVLMRRPAVFDIPNAADKITWNSWHMSGIERKACMPQMGAGGEPTEVDKAVAKLIVEEIPNGACLQLGIGGMPNTVGSMIAESDLKDLGVHTEMYVDAFVDISRAGKINGSKKAIDRGRQVFAFGAGTQKLYDFVNDNPECMSAPVSYTNDARTIAQIDNFISINNIVDVDLFGQMNAESAGIKQISGAGGQLDFVLGAYLSKGGKSFICCSSTFKKKDGTLESRIRPTLENGSVVTDARPCAHWFVTEYGKVNLKGLTAWQRAEALISVAHPDFREQLIQEAEKMRIWKRSNKR